MMQKGSLRNNKAYLAIIIFVVFVFCFLTISFESVSQDRPDPITHCFDDVAKHTVLLIDQTDSLSDRCCLQLQKLIEQLADETLVNDKLSIYTIEANSDIDFKAKFSSCNPGSYANEWLENVKLKIETYEKHFLNRIQSVESGVINAPVSDLSPIIETVNRVAEMEGFNHRVPNRKLIVFSDMLQNSYNCSDYPKCKEKLVDPLAGGCPDLLSLANVEVAVYYVVRPELKHLQSQNHFDRWKYWLESVGATVSMRRIQ